MSTTVSVATVFRPLAASEAAGAFRHTLELRQRGLPWRSVARVTDASEQEIFKRCSLETAQHRADRAVSRDHLQALVQVSSLANQYAGRVSTSSQQVVPPPAITFINH